ncbi:GAF domain-containing protein [Flammeovirga kamogawensis]|uniref:GAF domain-containing protein n=1 Tax=Flammeovirga kamogawensis TaxID=373891 RepID=A0ABX8GU97_9BACT|nr:GAF domain-containing protein [Flammeovirga kamogawensis]MBB6459855.1 transcriptional regulator with GAF, ATPase, and Fis domain [Flammeovirga kamogawensis]QWG07091.1 GAF domain-containing protein [Flammeovirga kamogawensis]TRX68912.1 GAF domain-containing protein [Flammeovirga kamogawensis]
MKTGYLDQALSIYQNLTRELTFKGLCTKILSTVTSTSIVEKASIIIKSGDDFVLKAYQARTDNEPVFSESNRIAFDDDLPLGILSQIKESKSTVFVDVTKGNQTVSSDLYVKLNSPTYINFIPLWNEDVIVGFLMLEQFQNLNSTPESIKFLQLLAPQIAILLQNAVALESYKKLSTAVEPKEEKIQKDTEQDDSSIKKSDLKVLGDIGQIIATSHTIESMIQTVYQKINKLIDAQTLDIGVYNEEKGLLEFPSSYEDGEKLPYNTCDIKEGNRLATICFNENRIIHINNFDDEIRDVIPAYEVTAPRVGKKVKSIIYVPIIDKNEVIGVITVQSGFENAYNPDDIYLIRNISSYIAIAIDNINLSKSSKEQEETHILETKMNEEKLTKAYTTLKSLGEIGQDITSNLSIERISDTAYESLNSLIDAPLFSIGIYNKDRGVLEVSTNIEHGEKLPPKTILLTDNSKLSVQCFKTLKEIIINDIVSEYATFLPNTKLPYDDVAKMPQSLIYLPLIGKEGTLGFITVQSYKSHAFLESDLNVLRNIAIYIGIALDNALTYEGLEEIVTDRTAELQQQKQEVEANRDEIEQSYKNVQLLSDIGVTLSSSLSVDGVIETVYKNVHSLMDATTFGIGIYKHRKQQIEFRGAMEKGEKLPFFIHEMSDKTKLSSIALIENKDIVISDITTEIYDYIDADEEIKTIGDMPFSIIYLPLRTKEKLIGVITVQSFKKNSYSELQVNLLKNIAVLSAIAIDNAVSYEKIERQKEELQSTSQKITSSIKYAKQIQSAILPNRTVIRNLLPDSFIFHKPKDIVSGDFFWFHQEGNRTFIATVDCNNNGVPGAMMSIIGTSLFREIVEIQGVTSPDEIIALMNQRLSIHLSPKTQEKENAIDISLCVIDKDANVMEFAGANTSLVRIANDKFYFIKGTPVSISSNSDNSTKFKKHTFDLNDNATYYMYTDGYAQQIGGEDKKEFSNDQFLKLLNDNYKTDKSAQRTSIRRAFNDWMENELVQTDDVLVLGFSPNA